MSFQQLLDAKTGQTAGINDNRQVLVRSTSSPLLWEKLQSGDAYYISSGVNCFFGGNSTGTSAGSYVSTEHVVAEFQNNTGGDVMIVNAECSLGKPHTLSPYTPFLESTHDIEVRFNQWLYQGSVLSTSGNNGLSVNLNRVSTNTLEARSNGNGSMRWANTTTGITTAGAGLTSSTEGYICGFRMDYHQRPKKMLIEEQPTIIGKGQSWVVSMVPMQNSSPTNMTFNVRASIIKL